MRKEIFNMKSINIEAVIIIVLVIWFSLYLTRENSFVREIIMGQND